MEITKFETEDVITASIPGTNPTDENGSDQNSGYLG